MPPSLELNQQLKVARGKHQSKEGKAVYYHGNIITLLLPDGSEIYVDQDDIDFKFDAVAVTLMMDEDERAEFEEVVKRYKEGYSS